MPRATHNQRHARGFTLAEMLVAVGLVALLTVGIGQVFQNISRLVSTGASVAEVDQHARAIEKQLRDDFEAVTRLASDEFFLVIRNRTLEPTYTTRQEQEADLRRGLARPDTGSAAKPRRLDELCVLAFAGESGAFSSYQHNGYVGGNDIRALHARLYYGHGLRRAPDLRYDPELDTAPYIHIVPDGDFGQEPGEDNVFDPFNTANTGDVSAWGLNEFAGDWIMVRQSLLLYGGRAAGEANTEAAPIGNDREFAPYIRDAETLARFGAAVGDTHESGGLFYDRLANPRLIGHGVTDICAQDLDDVRRWLEGRDPDSAVPPQLLPDATAYTSGILDNTMTPPTDVVHNDPDAPLFVRTIVPNRPDLTRYDNSRRVQSACAGVLQRIICSDTAPAIDRGGADSIRNPEDALMDLHAVLASHCSSIEIAWSDGTTAVRDEDFDNDGEDDAAFGDVIWFDINFTRQDLQDHDHTNYRAADEHLLAEIEPGRRAASNLIGFATRAGAGWVEAGPDPDAANALFRGYSAYLTRGAPDDRDEYLGIWPFRRPSGGGDYSGAWTKPQLVRFRITLHDSLGRLPEGKTFEFIFSLAPNDA